MAEGAAETATLVRPDFLGQRVQLARLDQQVRLCSCPATTVKMVFLRSPERLEPTAQLALRAVRGLRARLFSLQRMTGSTGSTLFLGRLEFRGLRVQTALRGLQSTCWLTMATMATQVLLA
jgi:hypothetical protein